MQYFRGARGALDTAGLRRLQAALLLSPAMLLATGCETVGYYGQAIRGQADLLLSRQPVAELVDDAETDPALRARLRLTSELLAFAEEELSLDVGGRYRDYVALDRDAVVYNVFASPPYELVPVRWCFPIAGCVSYRGYFSEAAARAKADALAASGLDVYVGGAAAYSTLGWFDDPLLSTFIDRDAPALAELLFHELAHGVLYVPGETAFNESFATFVGREGARRWLAARSEEEARARWEARSSRRADFVRLTLELRAELAEGYAALRAAESTDAERIARKAALWETLRADWLARRAPELAPWDGFFAAEASNARLNTVADYNVHLPAFAALFAETGADLPAFLERCRALAADAEARAAFLGTGAVAGARGG